MIEGIKEVNYKIKEILGIDDKQFKQIAMMPKVNLQNLFMQGVKSEKKYYAIYLRQIILDA